MHLDIFPLIFLKIGLFLLGVNLALKIMLDVNLFNVQKYHYFLLILVLII